MLEVGAVVGGKFRVDKLVGKGGMGVVAIATHLQLAQQVALKVLHEPLAADPTARDRFLREAQAPNRLKSDNVCRVFDVGTLDSGAPYIVMELLEGTDLASVGQLAIPVAVDYVLQAMIALAEAHALGIVHRDLKPANLFVTRRIDGSPLVKVLDFGIAKSISEGDPRLTHTTALMGSPHYMSPEQLRSARDVDPRADIWALGAILYELVSGRVPFPATTIAELAMKVAMEPPDPLPVDPAYQRVVFRCLEKNLDTRYQNVGELARDLAPLGTTPATSALIERLVGARGPTLPAIAPTLVVVKRSRRMWWLAAALAVAGGMVATAFAVKGDRVAPGLLAAVERGALARMLETHDGAAILTHPDYAGSDPELMKLVATVKEDYDADIDRMVMSDIEQDKDCEGARELLAEARKITNVDTLDRADDQCFADKRKLPAPKGLGSDLGSDFTYADSVRLSDIATAVELLGSGAYSAARLSADYVLGRVENHQDQDAAHVILLASCHLNDAERAREMIVMIKPPLADSDRAECAKLGVKL